MTEDCCHLVNVFHDEWLFGSNASHDSVSEGFDFPPRRRTPTEYRHRGFPLQVLMREAQVP